MDTETSESSEYSCDSDSEQYNDIRNRPKTTMSLTEGNHTPVVSISESDIAKIALTVKQFIMEEVRSIVDDKQKPILEEIKVIKEKQEIIDNKYGEEIKDLKLQINTLKRRNDELEQHSRKQCIRFSGVPFTEKENTDEKVIDIAKKLSVDILPSDISVSHRTGRSSPRQIIVRIPNHNIKKKNTDVNKTHQT